VEGFVTHRNGEEVNTRESRLVQIEYSEHSPQSLHTINPDSCAHGHPKWRRTRSGNRYVRLRKDPPPKLSTADQASLHYAHTSKELRDSVTTLLDLWVPSHADYAPDIQTAYEIYANGVKQAREDHEIKRNASCFMAGATQVISQKALEQWHAQLNQLREQAFTEAKILYEEWD